MSIKLLISATILISHVDHYQKAMKREFKVILAVTVIGIALGSAYAASRYLDQPSQTPTSVVQVVAAENFWGSLVSQLGGTRTQVLSIVTDPNADPHDYESNAADARAFATASLVIVNGAGYDTWAQHLMSANGIPNQKLLNVADLLGKKEGDNPHFWYSPNYVNVTVHEIYLDLVSIDPSSTTYYHQQYTSLNASLSGYNARIDAIRQLYQGTRVASTESIFEYLAAATGLNLISPPGFMKAVSEGSGVTAQDQATFLSQIQNRTAPGNATLLVFNLQTATQLTEQMKSIAVQNHIPIVPVTETIQPADVSFQDWMSAELLGLQVQLNPTIDR